MATTADFRNGLVIEYNGELFAIIEFQHVKPGKGGAFVRTKLKNVVTGRVIDNTFRAGEKVETVRLTARQMQFLYMEGEHYIFMDGETYEQYPFDVKMIGPDIAKYLKDGEEYKVLFNESQPLVVELPLFLELEVKETEPAVKGDTVSTVTKSATLETGAVVQVPLFVEAGEILKVDTRTDSYIERAKR